MVVKVISGGQTGADIAGVEAAMMLGVGTGGAMPRGYKTLDGNRPRYNMIYNMYDTASSAYPPRTYENVKNSNGTIRFYTKSDSPGELLTLKALAQYKKPYIDVDFASINPTTVKDVKQWIIKNKIKILNVAGNSEQTSRGIENATFRFMVAVLSTHFRA